MFQDRASEQGKTLVKVDLAGVDADGILGLFQRRDGPVHILVIPLADIGQHRLIHGVLAFLAQFPAAAVGPGLGAGGQVDFHGGVGQHHGADIPAIHEYVLAAGQAPLGVQQESPHRGMGRNCRRRHADGLGTDGLAYILTVEVDVLPHYL